MYNVRFNQTESVKEKCNASKMTLDLSVALTVLILRRLKRSRSDRLIDDDRSIFINDELTRDLLLQNSRRRSCSLTRTKMALSLWRNLAWLCDLWDRGRLVSESLRYLKNGNIRYNINHVPSTCIKVDTIWLEATN